MDRIMIPCADYLISKVRYDPERKRIESVEVRRDMGDKVSDPVAIIPRNIIVQNIEKHIVFMTIFKSARGWCKGRKVEVVAIDDQKFVRTDRNNVPKDSLDDLPEF